MKEASIVHDLENFNLLQKDKKILETTQVPIVTVSASFRDDLAHFHGVDEYFGEDQDEVLFSRAHYSMALAAAIAQWKSGVHPQKAWLVDPTNYVTREDWKKVAFTEEVGKAMARFKVLKTIKDAIDTKVRNKLPITDAITTPLLYLFEHVHKPILSFHYETGNILAKAGKQVVQVVTDPHVRDQYLENAQLPSIRFCVFDENTRTSFLEKADIFDKKIDPRRVIVTGPPVDPRIVAAGKHKKADDHTKRELRLCITTGGLGNNQKEIEACFRSLAPFLRHSHQENELKVHVIVYVGVHGDLREIIHDIANQEGIPTARFDEVNAPLRILYSPHVVTANELLIRYAFPWADGFVTKPSGDMAYEAAAAGCFLLTLEPWGEWEHNIRDVFEQKGVSRRAEPKEFAKQLESLTSPHRGEAWTVQAIHAARTLPDLFTHGIENILAEMPKN